ncbi:tyrosine-type recombinase/integrase [Nitratireductor sp. ZSWI3]|uniref:tyrosine-type recombinase/integrase n=1 Tax=Nitratireductor sp. ZSWI3 TaxID=2966359 RepID=UPI002150236B|nr:tyrosine-type recombinase/integrase [Nitratireductor sp. ZSWI3]MCR4267098.1 tyrosine-type recombinase/integrase [Nitratireductor sp. ZSWI3]
MKRRNPYPGLTRVVDRHGKVRWRFRMKGKPSCYIPGEYGSKAFDVAYESARKGETPAPEHSLRADHGTFSWLIEQYMRAPEYERLNQPFKRNLQGEIERFRREHGDKTLANLRPRHVEGLIARKAATPAAANKLLKLIRRLCVFAVKREYIAIDPTYGVKGYKASGDGYHTWDDAEIAKFEGHHGTASKAVLALRLMLYTGAARQDAAAMGRQNIKNGRIAYRRHKTGGEVDLPIHPELAAVLAGVPADRMLFITHGKGRSYNAATFGNWFHDMCVAAGLTHCSPHGLRKAGATRLANAGCSEFEIMAFLGHRTPAEAKTYTKRANRAKLGDSGMAKLLGVSNPVTRLDNRRAKRLKPNGK